MTTYQKGKLLIMAAFVVGVLVISLRYSENGRYAFFQQSPIILDTKTGEMLIPKKG